MRKSIIVFAFVSAMITVAGCSKGPNKNDATGLAIGYLSNMVPGITKDEISILKTFEKDGDTIVVVQAGGMLCDMPVIKGKDGWLARGISCSGQFESPEKAAVRKKNAISTKLKAEINESNKKLPKEEDGLKTDKMLFENNTIILKLTLLEYNSSDIKTTFINEKKNNWTGMLCSDPLIHDYMYNDIAYEYRVYDKNGTSIFNHIVNKNVCSQS